MGLSTDAINRLGMASDQAKAMLDSMPIAYAVTYMFGTVGSALVIALLGPLLLRINLPAACKDYEEKQGGLKEYGGAGSAWHRWETRAFQVQHGGIVNGLRAVEAEVADSRRASVCPSRTSRRWNYRRCNRGYGPSRRRGSGGGRRTRCACQRLWRRSEDG